MTPGALNAFRAACAVVECYVFAEVMYGILSPGNPRLYELAWEQYEQYRARAKYRAQVMSTFQMIRRLPEHDA